MGNAPSNGGGGGTSKMGGGGGGGGGGNGGEHKSGPRTTTSNESEEMAALKAKIKQMEEAANKVMDSHEVQQLTLHLAAPAAATHLAESKVHE